MHFIWVTKREIPNQLAYFNNKFSIVSYVDNDQFLNCQNQYLDNKLAQFPLAIGRRKKKFQL